MRVDVDLTAGGGAPDRALRRLLFVFSRFSADVLAVELRDAAVAPGRVRRTAQVTFTGGSGLAARGKLGRAEAERARIDAELRWMTDVVAVELHDAHSALVSAHARVGLAREQLQVAHALEQAERRRFELGDSTLSFVNLREQAAADAATQELEALTDYHRAFVDLRVAAGQHP